MSDGIIRFADFWVRTPEGEEKFVSLNPSAVVSVEVAPVGTPDFPYEDAGPKTLVRMADGRAYVLPRSMTDVFARFGYDWL